MARTLALVLTFAGALACGCGSGGTGGGAAPPSGPPAPPPGPPGWVVVAREDFSMEPFAPGSTPAFTPDPVPDDGPYSEGGAFFRARGVVPPAAYRATGSFGAGGWLSVEAYTRRADA